MESEGYRIRQEAMKRKTDEATLRRKEQVALTAIRKVLQKAGDTSKTGEKPLKNDEMGF